MHTVLSLKAAFEKYIAQYKVRESPRTLYGPVEYAMSQSGKRIRPVLVLLGYTMYRDDYARAMPAALALEYFHNFTLVHDDIMDAAMLRRGMKSVHARYGTNAAILSGDLMMIQSFDLLLSACGPENARQVLEVFSDTAIQICEGQQLDMDFETREGVSVEDYLGMIEKKTAVLLGCALQVGALLAGAPDLQAEVLNETGIDMGKAFQIQDDILDAYGDEELTGKRRGGDILQKKKSILYALAWESSKSSDRAVLSDLYNSDAGNPEVKIQKVLNLFDKLHVKDTADEHGMQCFHSAQSGFEKLAGGGINTAVLDDFASSLLSRQW